MNELIAKPRYITFDCYGTLVQWHGALRTAVRAVLCEHGAPAGPDEALVIDTVEALRTLSMEQQRRQPYRDYKTILQSSLAEALAGKGMSSRAGDGELLLSRLRRIAPHPEVPAALKHLRGRFRIAIISNSDDDLIAGTAAGIGVPIDHVVTAQQARAYKPDHQLFHHAHAALGVTSEETVHVGMGQVTDLKVCHELGIRVVWINRLGESLNPEWTPNAVLPDLTSLPELLA